MERPRSKDGERCRGKLATEAAWAGECVGAGRSPETRWIGKAGHLPFRRSFLGKATPWHRAFVLGEGAVPGSLSPALLCGPSLLLAPECTRPTRLRCPAASRRPGKVPGVLSGLSSEEQLGRGRAGLGRRDHRAGCGARAWRVLRSPSAHYQLVDLEVDVLFSGKLLAPEFFGNLICFLGSFFSSFFLSFCLCVCAW